MTRQAVVDFLAHVVARAALRRECRDAIRHRENRAAAVVAVARNHGFEFGAQHFVEIMDALHRHAGGALTDSEVEAATGVRVRVSSAGVAQYEYSDRNPFTYEDVRWCWEPNPLE